MFGKKLSDVGVLQQHARGIHSLHERKQHEVAQFDVHATKLAYLVRRGVDNTDWLSSKILVDLQRIEVLECTTRGDGPEGRNGTSSISA